MPIFSLKKHLKIKEESDLSIYLDYAATTPVHPDVVACMTDAFLNDFGNPSSTYQLGRDVRHKIESCRRTIAETLNAKAEDIIFTSSGTEANTTALLETAERLQSKGRHIISSQVEHSSVYQCMHRLEEQGFDVTYLDLDPDGHISLDDFQAALREDTIIVSIMHGNNELGSLQPIEEVGKICQERGIFFHTDTVQTYMKVPIDVEALHIDALALSAHKIHGPKGIGFLYYRDSKQNFKSYLPGGGQEHGKRASTESYPLIAGLTKAVDLAKDNLAERMEKLRSLRQYFLDGAEARGLNFQINGPKQAELANILNIYWPGHPSDQTLIKCDLQDVYLSAGSACSAGSLEPSRVLVNLYGEEDDRIRQSLRLSFDPHTSQAELDQVLDLLASFDS